ncbi:MAG: O-antigen ligase family protein [Planctomycetota bacterium]|nr:O-antigen ligase family protein [Planctomycetota bacterium]
MKVSASNEISSAGKPGRRNGAADRIVLVLLLAALAARLFLAEMPFQTSSLRLAGLAGVESSGAGRAEAITADRTELSRVTFAMLLLAAWAVWLIGRAGGGSIIVRHGWLALVVLAFAAVSLAGALSASDKRAAMNAWVEQVSLLAAGLLAVQLFTDRRRFALLAVVLVGVGATLAVKGLWQVRVDVPDRIADFRMYRAERLEQLGWSANSPQAKLIEQRMSDPAPFGFFALANVFASVMIVLFFAAAGLAVDKFRAAARSRRSERKSSQPGDVHLPTLAAILAAAAAALVGLVLILTRSRGGILAAAAAAVAAGAVYLLGERLRRYWRRAVLVVVVLFVLGAAAVLGYGLARDRLPTKTMTFRWFYWTAAGRIVRDRPLLGVGGGNFPAAYLRYRRPEAEEAVKMPHNVFVHAAAEYGLVGGALYLAAIGYVLVSVCRPRKPGDEPPLRQSDRNVVWRLLAVVVAAGAGRCIFGAIGSSALLLLFEAILPAVVLAVMLAMACWAGAGPAAGLDAPSAITRIALACGLAGFVLHNMVTFSLWTPAAAMVFWLCAGACLGRAGEVRPWRCRRLRWAVALGGAVAVVACGWAIWRPVYAKSIATERMLAGLVAGDPAAAVPHARRAAQADPLDAQAAADAAMVILRTLPGGDQNARKSALRAARLWAEEAKNRNPDSYGAWRLAGEIAWQEAVASAEKTQVEPALRYMARAAELNPMDIRLRVAFARMLCSAGRAKQCLRELHAAEYVDRRLLTGSVEHFNPAEQAEIERLRARAKFMERTTGAAR